MSEYQEKLTLFKPDYPDMRKIKAQIDQIDREIQVNCKRHQGIAEDKLRIVTAARNLAAKEYRPGQSQCARRPQQEHSIADPATRVRHQPDTL